MPTNTEEQGVHGLFLHLLVANVGGSLTRETLLFLGFLHSVPFFWTMPVAHMSLVAFILLVIYFILDRYHYRFEKYSRKWRKNSAEVTGCTQFPLPRGNRGGGSDERD